MTGIPKEKEDEEKKVDFERIQNGLCVVFLVIAIIGASMAVLAFYNMQWGGEKVPEEKRKGRPNVGVMVVNETMRNFDQANKLEKNLKDNHIKAVVLKVNSPGGSVQSCFQMQSVLDEISEDKPVVAFLQEQATSGAYLVSSAADRIVARKYTQTAGLGVISVWTSHENQYREKGIKHFVFKSAAHKDVYAPWRGPTENEKEAIRRRVERLSEQFFSKIENNRPSANLLGLRDGTTIYGKEALKRGLVDNLGTFQDAIDMAVEMAGLDNYETAEYDVRGGGFTITIG